MHTRVTKSVAFVLTLLVTIAASTGDTFAQTVAPVGGVWVHVDGPSGMALQRDLDSMHTGDVETVCVVPCDTHVPSDLRYRLSGAGHKTTEPFELSAPDGGRERISVRGGSKTWFILGWIGVGIGGGVAIVGMDVLLAPVLASTIPGADGRVDSSNHPGHPVVGWTMLGAGIALGIASLTLAIGQRRTHVTQDPQDATVNLPRSIRSTSESHRDESRLNADRLREDALAPALPRPLFLPIVDARF